jgi:hypothetical protein
MQKPQRHKVTEFHKEFFLVSLHPFTEVVIQEIYEIKYLEFFHISTVPLRLCGSCIFARRAISNI